MVLATLFDRKLGRPSLLAGQRLLLKMQSNRRRVISGEELMFVCSVWHCGIKWRRNSASLFPFDEHDFASDLPLVWVE